MGSPLWLLARGLCGVGVTWHVCAACWLGGAEGEWRGVPRCNAVLQVFISASRPQPGRRWPPGRQWVVVLQCPMHPPQDCPMHPKTGQMGTA